MKAFEIRNFSENYEGSRKHIKTFLKKHRVSDTLTAETLLIFEALCHNIFDQPKESGIVVRVSVRERVGNVSIRLDYEGPMYVPEHDDQDSFSPEKRILRAFDDKIDYSYRSGYNRIMITVRRGNMAFILPCLAGIVLALVVYLPVFYLTGTEGKHILHANVTLPLTKLFTNAMLMVAGPVTFLSFLKNLSDNYIIAEHRSGAKKLHQVSVYTSLISVFLAILTSFLVRWIFKSSMVNLKNMPKTSIQLPGAGSVSSLIPSDILTPFTTISPFPLFMLAAIVTYALCYSGKYFDLMKEAIEAAFALFSGMLSIVMFALPFFVFTALEDILLTNGFQAIEHLALLILIVMLSLSVLILFYTVRLLRSKVSLPPFLKKLWPLLYENLRIGSSIDAAPFNIRYCATKYHINRKTLETAIPVLAQVNLDGNCFFITLVALLLMDYSKMTLLNVALVGILVFFLSLGAPNQPGSFLIATAIILKYMHADHYMSLAIFCEVFFGWLLNITNVLGDIVTIAELNQEGTGSQGSHRSSR